MHPVYAWQMLSLWESGGSLSRTLLSPVASYFPSAGIHNAYVRLWRSSDKRPRSDKQHLSITGVGGEEEEKKILLTFLQRFLNGMTYFYSGSASLTYIKEIPTVRTAKASRMPNANLPVRFDQKKRLLFSTLYLCIILRHWAVHCGIDIWPFSKLDSSQRHNQPEHSSKNNNKQEDERRI